MDRDDLEICILAGGLSSRMGRDKARLRLGRRTLLGHARANAAALGLPVRVIRRDVVSRCGPLGGIYTALRTTRKRAVIFLACDMPFVEGSLVDRLLNRFDGARAVFATAGGRAGFPLVLPQGSLPVVERRLGARDRSLHALAAALGARQVRVSRELVFNVNSPEELARAKERLKVGRGSPSTRFWGRVEFRP